MNLLSFGQYVGESLHLFLALTAKKISSLGFTKLKYLELFSL